MTDRKAALNEFLSNLRERWATLRAWLSTDTGGRVLLILILAVAAYLRWSHLNWDQGTHIHPDERFLTMVESALQLPKSVGEFFDSTRSPMSPYNKNFGFFVYGTLPIFIVRVFAEFLQKLNEAAKLWTVAPNVAMTMTGYDGVHLVGRWLSGLADLAGVWLIYVIGQRLYSRKVGLLAALLLAFAPLALQQSHFFTVDTFGTFFALLTFYFAVRVAQGGEQNEKRKTKNEKGGGGWLTYVALGASLGASIACRINLAPLAGIALLAAGIRAWDDWQAAGGRRQESGNRGFDAIWLGTLLQATLFRLLLMGIVAIVVFRMAQPYAFGGKTAFDFTLAKPWLDNMRQVSQLMSGDADSPPGHQWTSRTPFVFPWVNMVVWGMGLPMGLAAWAGWLVALLQVIRGLTRLDKVTRWHGDTVTRWQGDKVTEGGPSSSAQEITASPDHRVTPSPLHRVTVSPLHRVTPSPWRSHLLPVIWIGGMFLWQGLQYVQSMRYLLPIYPALAMMAAWGLWWVVEKAGNWKLETGSWRLEAGNRKLAGGGWLLASSI